MPDNESLRWLTLNDPHLRPHGLWWFDEHGGELFRYPRHFERNFEPVDSWRWRLTTHPSGARLRFRSDTGRLVLRLETWHDQIPPGGMSELSRRGVECTLNGEFQVIALSEQLGLADLELYRDPGIGGNEFTLWLPTYNPIRVHGIGVALGARVEAPAPYRLPRPLLALGSSITQGANASRPSLTWPARVARRLNLDFVNLGATGATDLSDTMAEVVAEVDASGYLLKIGITHVFDLPNFPDRLNRFADRLRERRPKTPLLFIGPLAGTRHWDAERRNFRDHAGKLNEVLLEQVSRRRSAGDSIYSVRTNWMVWRMPCIPTTWVSPVWRNG
ncbi:MAG: hypothetical protein HYV35_02380 [Lentisphaerae bacterium]|nr:hypothetical protein [Lentisphaerota bacterium]